MEPAMVRDEVLIAAGFAPNDFILDLNRCIQIDYKFKLPSPWGLPSRLFKFPIELGDREEGGVRRIGLMHPLLGDHPFVVHVGEVLGIELDPNGAPNRHGVRKGDLGQWWHAADLMTSGHWRELLETKRFTDDEAIAGAVGHALHYQNEDERRALSVKEAREVMKHLGFKEPANSNFLFETLWKPSPCQQEKGGVHWAINHEVRVDGPARAWSTILGIEEGWFSYRGRYLQWTQEGRDRYAAGGQATYVETKTGQMAFLF